jgi:hypothetical protein
MKGLHKIHHRFGKDKEDQRHYEMQNDDLQSIFAFLSRTTNQTRLWHSPVFCHSSRSEMPDLDHWHGSGVRARWSLHSTVKIKAGGKKQWFTSFRCIICEDIAIRWIFDPRRFRQQTEIIMRRVQLDADRIRFNYCFTDCKELKIGFPEFRICICDGRSLHIITGYVPLQSRAARADSNLGLTAPL